MIVDVAVFRAWAIENRVKNVLPLECRAVVGAAKLEGGAGSFVKANVEIELGHLKNAGLEG